MRNYQEHSNKHQPRIDFYEKYENKTLNSTLAQATLVLINRDIANDWFHLNFQSLSARDQSVKFWTCLVPILIPSLPYKKWQLLYCKLKFS